MNRLRTLMVFAIVVLISFMCFVYGDAGSSTSYTIDSTHRGLVGDEASSSSYDVRFTQTYQKGSDPDASSASYIMSVGWFVTVTEIGNVTIESVACTNDSGNSWFNCSDVSYGDTVDSVRVECSGDTSWVTISLTNDEGIDYNQSDILNESYDSKTNDFYYFDINYSIKDSGNWTLNATCVGVNTELNQSDWELPWGQLQIAIIQPLANLVVGLFDLFTVNSTVSCVGGECGNITITLDPYEMSCTNQTVCYDSEVNESCNSEEVCVEECELVCEPQCSALEEGFEGIDNSLCDNSCNKSAGVFCINNCVEECADVCSVVETCVLVNDTVCREEVVCEPIEIDEVDENLTGNVSDAVVNESLELNESIPNNVSINESILENISVGNISNGTLLNESLINESLELNESILVNVTLNESIPGNVSINESIFENVSIGNISNGTIGNESSVNEAIEEVILPVVINQTLNVTLNVSLNVSMNLTNVTVVNKTLVHVINGTKGIASVVFDSNVTLLNFSLLELGLDSVNVSKIANGTVVTSTISMLFNFGPDFLYNTPVLAVDINSSVGGVVTLPKNSEMLIDTIYKCDNWNFNASICVDGWYRYEDVSNIEQNDTYVSFEVDSFSAYVGGYENLNETSWMIIWDENDYKMPYSVSDNTSLKKVNENISFYADYKHAINGSLISGANCTLNLSNALYAMNYDSDKDYYVYVNNFTSEGVYDYYVNCSAGNYTVQYGNDSIFVGNATGQVEKGGAVSTVVGATPFYTISVNPVASAYLFGGDVASTSWVVNATEESLGTYEFFVEANGSLVEYNKSDIWYVSIADNTSDLNDPEIVNALIDPDRNEVGNATTFYMVAHDDYRVDSCYVDITLPNTTVVRLNDLCNVSKTYTGLEVGNYSAEFVAIDSHGRSATTVDSFEYFDYYDLNITVEIGNSTANVTVRIYEDGTQIAYNTTNTSKTFVLENGVYDILFEAYSDVLLAKLFNVNLTSNSSNKVELVSYGNTSGFEDVYGVDTNMTFSVAQISLDYSGLNYTSDDSLVLYVCHNWSIANGTCLGSWEVLSSTNDKTADTLTGNVSSLSGFAIKESVSVPVVSAAEDDETTEGSASLGDTYGVSNCRTLNGLIVGDYMILDIASVRYEFVVVDVNSNYVEVLHTQTGKYYDIRGGDYYYDLDNDGLEDVFFSLIDIDEELLSASVYVESIIDEVMQCSGEYIGFVPEVKTTVVEIIPVEEVEEEEVVEDVGVNIGGFVIRNVPSAIASLFGILLVMTMLVGVMARRRYFTYGVWDEVKFGLNDDEDHDLGVKKGEVKTVKKEEEREESKPKKKGKKRFKKTRVSKKNEKKLEEAEVGYETDRNKKLELSDSKASTAVVDTKTRKKTSKKKKKSKKKSKKVTKEVEASIVDSEIDRNDSVLEDKSISNNILPKKSKNSGKKCLRSKHSKKKRSYKRNLIKNNKLKKKM